MRKSPAKVAEPTKAQKAAALARALKKIEDTYAVPRKAGRAKAPDAVHEDEEAKARRQKALENARERREAWMRDPPWFSFYSPYHSVLGGGTPQFVDRNGVVLSFRSSDSARLLLYQAKAAADEYLSGNTLSEEDWRKALGEWKRLVKDMKADLAKQNIEFRDPLGGVVTPDFEEMGAFQVLSIAYQIFRKTGPRTEDEARIHDGVGMGAFHQLWCVVCLNEIDSALLAVMYEDAGDGISSAIRATEALSNARECANTLKSLLVPEENAPTRETLVVPLRREFALAGAKAKLAKDPKQRAKREVKEWWFRWRENPGWYTGKSDFARAMLDKFPTLTNQPVIADWCRKWEKEAGKERAHVE
jgi:hypothetical protein